MYQTQKTPAPSPPHFTIETPLRLQRRPLVFQVEMLRMEGATVDGKKATLSVPDKTVSTDVRASRCVPHA